MNRTDDLVSRLTSPNQYSRDGHRAPHKPLLVLMALGNLASEGTSAVEWSTAESQLSELIAEFGPTSATSAAQSAAYPFTRLRSDHVWILNHDVAMDSVTELRSQPTVGRFVPELESALKSDPTRLLAVARSVVSSQFPPSLVADVLSAVGLDPEQVYSAPGPTATTVVGQQLLRRSGKWRREVLLSWDNCCAFCGYDGSMGRAPIAIEAAHVRWFAFSGPDDLDNGLALCSLHHKLLDLGAVGFSDEQTLIVSQNYSARGAAGRAIYDLHRRQLDPRPGTLLPAAEHVAWHFAEVFKGPALAA